METAAVDPGARRRAASSAMLALALTGVGLGAAYWLQAMQIHRVGAPEGFAVASLEWALFEPPPPPTPPPAPKSVVVDDAADDQNTPARSSAPPVAKSPDTAAAGETGERAEGPVVPGDATARVPGLGAGGPPGLPPGVGTGTPCPGCSGPVGTPTPSPSAPPKPVPLSALECRVCPDPAAKALARTRTALTTKRGGTNVTSFCVDEGGRPYKIRTKRSFGDPTVDAVALDTVRRWRFTPMRVGSKTRKVCSSVSFHIEFR